MTTNSLLKGCECPKLNFLLHRHTIAGTLDFKERAPSRVLRSEAACFLMQESIVGEDSGQLDTPALVA